MGGKAGKIILPLIAIAATVATGPGGFGLWGTSAPAVAGEVAAGGTAAVGPSLAAQFATGLGGGIAIPAAGTAAAFEAASLAVLPAGAPLVEQSLFSSLLSSSGFNELSGIQQAGLGLQAASAGGNIVSGNINAAGQRAAIAFQEGQLKLQQSQDRLNITNKELESQRRLRATLATQNNFFAATGIDSSQGSAARLADAAIGSQGLEAGLLNNRARINSASSSSRLAALGSRRRRVSGAGATLGSLLDFGGAYASTVSRNRRLGKARYS